jgi:hypothetical protein
MMAGAAPAFKDSAIINLRAMGLAFIVQADPIVNN